MTPIHRSSEFTDRVQRMFEGYAAADLETARGVIRASTRLVEDCRSEAQLGEHLVICDEPADLGGTGRGPSPLQYFLASLGF